MGGTILNAITVAIGSGLGLLVGSRLSDRMQESVVTGIGLVTVYLGIDNASHTGNPIIPLLSILVGVILGEMAQIDVRLDRFAGALQTRFAAVSSSDQDGAGSRERFITGFVTASLVFCVGPLTVLGAVQDGMGLREGFDLLAIKSVLDGFASLAFAATFGVGVMFSIVTILGFQGGLALIGSIAGEFMTDAMTDEMTATGGLILLALVLTLLNIKKPRVANFLPALIVAPLLVAVATALGINIYPSLLP